MPPAAAGLTEEQLQRLEERRQQEALDDHDEYIEEGNPCSIFRYHRPSEHEVAIIRARSVCEGFFTFLLLILTISLLVLEGEAMRRMFDGQLKGLAIFAVMSPTLYLFPFFTSICKYWRMTV